MQENVLCVGFYQFLIQSDSYTKLKKLVIRTKKEISINWFIWLKVL